MTRLQERFKSLRESGDGGLIIFITGGDPDMETTVRAVCEFDALGVDAVELGIPFSDPLADGPVIQASSARALQRGTTIPKLLEAVREIRTRSSIPIVFMTYLNPVLQYGLLKFANDCVGVGVDGVLITDLPPEEATDWINASQRCGLDTVFLLAPTSTDERIRMVVNASSGFIYCVSRTGITGERDKMPAELCSLIERIRSATDKPIAVGFGISNPEHVDSVVRGTPADAAVVGSAVVRRMHEWLSKGSERGWQELKEFVASLKRATIGAKSRRRANDELG